jgi:hypothetical protein
MRKAVVSPKKWASTEAADVLIVECPESIFGMGAGGMGEVYRARTTPKRAH